jgi:A/G-specific adenine glycosylase
MEIDEKSIREFQDELWSWYEANGREFPWRNTSDPYKIMIAEFLLQKTNVRKVVDVYNRVINLYPDMHSLSHANQDQLEDIIEPLGFLNRADRLINAAKKIVNQYNGEIPKDKEKLMSIKGIGNYIATSILVFAFKEKRIVVDTNVIKVIEREFGIKSKKSRARNDRDLWAFAQTLAPDNKIRQFNWALLDYGASLDE